MVTLRNLKIDEIANYRLFAVAKGLDNSSIEIKLMHLNGAGETLVDQSKYDVFSIGDDILFAFKNFFEHAGRHNYVASDGVNTCFIGLQAYERIVDIIDINDDDHNNGVFTFLDSKLIIRDELDWRCDKTMYGPRLFELNADSVSPFLQELERIKVYEPIIGFNGIAHIAYIKLNNDDVVRNDFVNNSHTPLTGVTIPELFKLILEWSDVSLSPFNNTERIALQASSFVNQFGLDYSFVDGQSDMQVFEYLKGNQNARVRTSGSYAMNDKLRNLIMSSISYMTFSEIAQNYPGPYYDMDECRRREWVIVKNEWDNALPTYRVNTPCSFGDVDTACAYLRENDPGLENFVRIYFSLMAKRKSLLEK